MFILILSICYLALTNDAGYRIRGIGRLLSCFDLMASHSLARIHEMRTNSIVKYSFQLTKRNIVFLLYCIERCVKGKYSTQR
uniref:Secreted protein n=1 Tax=Pararge aegeria TaxID=116150 RepID=S4PE15_9NEOP